MIRITSAIRRYTDDFKKDAVAYVQDYPDIIMQEAMAYFGMPKEAADDSQNKEKY